MKKKSNGKIPMTMSSLNYEIFHYRSPMREVELHSHDFYEIFILLSSTVTYLIDGRYYDLQPNDILLIGPQEMHRPVALLHGEKEYERMDIYVRPAFIARLGQGDMDLKECFDFCAAEGGNNLLRPDGKRLRWIGDVLHRLQEQRDEDLPGRELLNAACVTELLVYLNQQYRRNRATQKTVEVRSNEQVDDMIRYIVEHLNQTLTLDMLADRYYVSKFHLSRKFKLATGLSPYQFIRSKRLLKARGLLQEGMSVTDVCHECGFSDYTNFIRAFKSQFGISPGRFGMTEVADSAPVWWKSDSSEE
ncbi:MAG: AraC family transcriptional regulator [Eubacteriales bacterium]|nr:AraC family transcriptional regulator [Eubacteriales bacterium]